MASATKISNAAAIAACNAIVDKLDDGAGAGKLEIRTGVPPANVDDPATGTLLSTHALSDPAFGAAADDDPGGKATADAIADDASADATGTAGWFRAYDSDDNPIIQGTAGEAADSTDLTLDNKDINAGQTVKVTSWDVTMPEG